MLVLDELMSYLLQIILTLALRYLLVDKKKVIQVGSVWNIRQVSSMISFITNLIQFRSKHFSAAILSF